VDTELAVIIFLVAVALFFDFLNGMHDAANSIATVVSTRVLTPLQAVVWAAFFNFAAALFFGVSVANTIGKGIIHTDIVNEQVIFSTLVGAIVWNALTIYLGLPVSSTHALVGGLVGAGLAYGGPDTIIVSGVSKVAIFMGLAPLIGFFVAAPMMIGVLWLIRAMPPRLVGRVFGRLQLLSAAAFSLGHGANDAQKTMGIISVLLFSTGHLGTTFYVPIWVIVSAYASISVGTLMGGWRIVRTLGMRVTELRPHQGFCAETAAALTLFTTAHAGIPASTTHTITGAIIGVGSTRRLSAVRWGVAGDIVTAWILTIPGAAVVSFLTYYATNPL
jgi:inorganic phosphate transporter, PiT family